MNYSFLAILKKDILIDLRRKEIFFSILLFALSILLIFNFTLPHEESQRNLFTPGLFWICFLFTSLMAITRTFQLEKENDCLTALLLSPIRRSTILTAKVLSNFLFICFIQIIIAPLFGFLFQKEVFLHFGVFYFIIMLSALGFSILGTTLSCMTSNLRFSEVLLPLLLFPLIIPLFLSSISLTIGIFSTEGLQSKIDWLKLLITFDLIFLIIAWVTFEVILE